MPMNNTKIETSYSTHIVKAMSEGKRHAANQAPSRLRVYIKPDHKTWFLVSLATHAATRGERVLYFNLNMQKPLFAHRISLVAEACDLEASSTLHILNARGYFGSASGFEPFCEILSAQTNNSFYGMVLVDPVDRFLRGHPNPSEVFEALDRLSLCCDTAITVCMPFVARGLLSNISERPIKLS